MMAADAAPGTAWPRFTPVGDHALLVSLGDTLTDATSAAVMALDQALTLAPPPGVSECVPALVNLLVEFDPLLTDHHQVRMQVQRLLLRAAQAPREGQLREVEVCYDDGLAPDLAAVAQASGLGVDAVIACHLQADYVVRMFGFAPGYAYLSGVPPAIQVPRKPSAVRGIPAGSVLIAGPQCLVTTLSMPTGWSIIGRSPTRILTPDDRVPVLFAVGDRVRFTRIDQALYTQRLAHPHRD
ncbi:MAG: allophanate hydrolase subunit 1 [Rubrivivax sp.]